MVIAAAPPPTVGSLSATGHVTWPGDGRATVLRVLISGPPMVFFDFSLSDSMAAPFVLLPALEGMEPQHVNP